MNDLKNPITRESKSRNNLLTLKKYCISFFITLTLSIFCFSMSPNYSTTKYNIINSNEYYKNQIIDSLKREVQLYINKIAPNSKVSADTIITACLKYKMDICFVLAQGHLESHFGTRGIATLTNSVFNVGAMGDGIIIRTYKTPNSSVEPYIILLIEKYLNNGKSVDILINNYKNKNGYRYAIAQNYEEQLKIIYYRLKDKTNINNLQNLL